MSKELEERLEHVLGQVGPSDPAGEQARAGAMAALAVSRHRRPLLLLPAAVLATLVLTAAALASDTVRRAVGIAPGHTGPPRTMPAPRGPLPPGAAGFAVVTGGRAVYAVGHRHAGLRSTAFELSPNAAYVAAGRRGRIDAIDPATGRVVVSHRVHGTVTAVSWAPIGIHIAYIVQRSGRSALHLIDGTLMHDRVVDRNVADVAPAWRWDSLAVAYVHGVNRVEVADLWRGRTAAVRRPGCAADAAPEQLAYAPHSNQLGVRSGAEVWVANTGHAAFCVPALGMPGPAVGGGFAWLTRHDIVETTFQYVQRLRVTRTRATAVGLAALRSGIEGVIASPDGRSLVLALRGRRVVLVDPPADHLPAPGQRPAQLPVRQVLHIYPSPPAYPVGLIWR